MLIHRHSLNAFSEPHSGKAQLTDLVAYARFQVLHTVACRAVRIKRIQ